MSLFMSSWMYVFFQVGVAGLNPTRRSSWGSAGGWWRTPSAEPCSSTSRKPFKTEEGPKPPETPRKPRQRRALQLTPLQTTGSDIIGGSYRDWKTSCPEHISQTWRTSWGVSASPGCNTRISKLVGPGRWPASKAAYYNSSLALLAACPGKIAYRHAS